jgi:AbrB family looped-hinge helix DNA binding protein
MWEKATTLTRKGQVTIPAEVRAILGLKPKDKIVFEVRGDTASLKRVPSELLRWYGAIPPRQRPEDFKELRDEFECGVADEVVQEG